MSAAPTREQCFALGDALLVHAPPDKKAIGAAAADGDAEVHILITAAGEVYAYNGHVDLGTGVRTALAQMVAEELDVSMARVRVVLGDTWRTPNQGPTIASDTIQNAATPLKQAAAQARRFLAQEAARRFGCAYEAVTVDDGVLRGPDGAATSFGELLRGARHHLLLDEATPLKPESQYRIVGKAVARVDIPDKVTGDFVYVHDVRVPGMLHGRVVRPPYGGRDAGEFIGHSLLNVDQASVAHIPGLVDVVVRGDFVGVVAEREEDAARAAAELKVQWRMPPELPDLNAPEQPLRDAPVRRRLLKDEGDVDAALDGNDAAMRRTYLWPYQLHGSIGPSCGVAHWVDGMLRCWSGTQNPHMLRNDLAALFDLDGTQVEVIRHEAAGCYGRNCADDVTADAALLARAVGRPVRVQLTREQEHVWEPKGASQLIEVAGAIGEDGHPLAYDFATRYPSNNAPLLATMLVAKAPAIPAVTEMGDRTSVPPYDYPNLRVVCNDMAPIVRAAWLRGVSALPSTFAHESFIDEMAAQAGVDPVEYRLRYLKEERAARLVRQVAEKANWVPRSGPWQEKPARGDVVHGRGFAYALYSHSKFPGYGAAWCAWVADVDVNKKTGEVAVTKVTVGQDTGLVINPAGVQHQIHGNVIQSTSRVLKEQVSFSEISVATRDWGAYPMIAFPEVPEIDVLMVPAPGEPPVGAGESASVPSAAAIANAIYDATGVRFRAPPFTPEVIRAGLNVGKLPAPDEMPEAQPQAAKRAKLPAPERPRAKRGFIAGLAAAGAALAGVLVAALPWRAPLPPIAAPDLSLYSAAALERGRVLAAAGDCATCHTAKGGAVNAGGLPLETPFGTVYSTNITPDRDTGIGAWSYSAFERAMREGIARDGRHLYPAFPYTAFAKMTDEDLQALYAYLMSRPPVAASVPKNELAFPYNARPLLAGWNAMFLRTERYTPDPARSAQWNRGAYLVEGVGHCGGCHTPRNALGAEQGGKRWLSGGMVDGWEAPALTSLSHAPVPWTEEELFRYLRTGFSPLHGVAAGPMAPVVREMAALPEDDVRAMAVYLASVNEPLMQGQAQARARALELRTANLAPVRGAALFNGACGACHSLEAPPLFGVKPALALNSNVHSATPDNLLRVMLHGIDSPADPSLGYMPGFANNMSDAQIAELADFVRAQFAPGKAPWTNTLERSRVLRGEAMRGR